VREGDTGLQGDGADGTCFGGFGGVGLDLGIGHGVRIGDLSEIAICARALARDLALNTDCIDSVGQPAYGDTVWFEAIGGDTKATGGSCRVGRRG